MALTADLADVFEGVRRLVDAVDVHPTLVRERAVVDERPHR